MIVVAYGANLDSQFGNPLQTFDKVKKSLKLRNIRVRRVSSLWDTSPVGACSTQPSYTNAVMVVECDKSPHELLADLLSIEAEIGRVRTVPNAPREVDLDLIDYNGMIVEEDPDLILPHPRMHSRKFVLAPLAEICPEWVHPETNQTVINLLENAPKDQDAERIDY